MMATKSKHIKGKLLLEAYTPTGADENDFSDGIAFEEVVGNRRFHSFQVWREKTGASATCIYGLSLKQLQAIVQRRDDVLGDEVETLEQSLKSAQKQIKSLEELIERQQVAGLTAGAIKKLRDESQKLREENKKFNEFFRLQGIRESKRNSVAYARGGFGVSTPTGGKPDYQMKRRPR
jgi:DNA-binding transcriptional MerR regulator